MAPFLDGSEIPAGWDLVSWDCEQAISVTFRMGDACILVECERRNDQLDCYTRTTRFNICVNRQFEDAGLDDDDRRLADAVIDILRRGELALPAPPRAEAGRSAEVREVLVDRVIIPEGKGH